MKTKIYKNVFIEEGCIIENDVEIGKIGKATKISSVTKIGKNSIIRSGTIIYAGATIGNYFQSGHNVLIREENIIEDNVSIGSSTELGLRNKISNNSRIHSHCFLEDVTIGKHVFIAPHVMFTNDPHPSCPDYTKCFKGAIVEDNAIIGGNATILPHIRIGKNALIGAGSVVTKDVQPFSVVAGNPARKIKDINNIICDKADSIHKPYEKNSLC